MYWISAVYLIGWKWFPIQTDITAENIISSMKWKTMEVLP